MRDLSADRPIIAPSLLAADFAHLGRECDEVLSGGADWLHFDVMDGAFVPNITVGPVVLRSLRRHTDAVLDVHLMIREPERYIEAFAEAGADLITVHVEATAHLHRAVEAIHRAGVNAGVSINPATSLSTLDFIAHQVEVILVMSVNPGFGGQSFIPETLAKVNALRGRLGPDSDVIIEVDGGVSAANIGGIADAGARAFVAGSAIFGSHRPYSEVIAELRSGAVGSRH